MSFGYSTTSGVMMKNLVFLLMLSVAVLPAQAQAGFDFAEDGITVSNMPNAAPAPQKKVEFTPPPPSTAPVMPDAPVDAAVRDPLPLNGASRPESDPSAPALTTFNDRYVPDTVKKKYKISPEWYVRGADVPISSLIEGDRNGPVAQPAPAAPPAQAAPASTAAPAMSVSQEVPEELDAPRGMSRPPLPASQPGTMVISDKPLQAPEVAVKAPTYVTVSSWRARKGEPVRDVIRRWSEREGTEMMWAAPNDPVLAKDFSKVGTLQDAVTGLLREVGQPLYTQYRSDGLNPVMMSPASTVTSDVAPEVAPQPPAAPVELVTAEPPRELRAQIIKSSEAELQPQTQPKPFQATLGPIEKETRWFALSGASLKEVLQVWADDEGAELIWQAGSDYALPSSVSQVGQFEDAVFKALSQFDAQEVNRPVGEMYKNPGTGQKVLLIKADNPS